MKNKICPRCGKHKRFRKCVVVAGKNLMELVTKTLGYYTSGQKYLSSKCQENKD